MLGDGSSARTRSRRRIATVVAVAVIAVVLVALWGAGAFSPSRGPASASGSGANRAPRLYQVTFVEQGLPAPTSWSVTFNASRNVSNATVLRFGVPNGTYAYTVGGVPSYASSVSSGVLEVAGANLTVDVTFESVPPPPPTTYPVAFVADGLPAALSWTVVLGNLTANSTQDTIALYVTNGTYRYTVGAPTGWTVENGNGSVTIDGVGQQVYVTFVQPSPGPYSVFVREGGLPAGTVWSYSVNGSDRITTSDEMTFFESNGSFAYSAGPVSGFTPSPADGTVRVAGINTTVVVYYYDATNRVALDTTFAFEFPVGGTCTATQVELHVCAVAGDQTFTFDVEQSTIDLGNVLFQMHDSAGGVFVPNGTSSFAIENASGFGVAYSSFGPGAGTNMTSLWDWYGGTANASTPIDATETVVVDVGVSAVAWVPGQGDYLVALGVGRYDGMTANEAIP